MTPEEANNDPVVNYLLQRISEQERLWKMTAKNPGHWTEQIMLEAVNDLKKELKKLMEGEWGERKYMEYFEKARKKMH